MKASLLSKLDHLSERHQEVSRMLGDAEATADQTQFRSLSQEYAELEPVVRTYEQYLAVEQALAEAKGLLEDTDPDMRQLAHQELNTQQLARGRLELELERLLLPHDPDDDKGVFLEIRAGTGGDEAAIFSGDLFRMYLRYADSRRWKVEVISERPGEHGGYKEIIAQVVGAGAYSRLKFESGAHRVQRVPETEAQGRIHTSACTVAVMPEVAAVDAIDINPADLRTDTYRSSGAGGQHVNTTDSAVRITHIPTGIVVECQDERSQHKNRAKAMALLQARILAGARAKQAQERSDLRRSLVGSGDRSERIRTYNFPQGRLTDHRINLTLYKLEEIVAGDLDAVIQPLINEHQAEQLAAMAE